MTFRIRARKNVNEKQMTFCIRTRKDVNEKQMTFQREQNVNELNKRQKLKQIFTEKFEN